MCFSHSQNTHTHKYYIYPSATKRMSHLIHVLPKYLDVNTYLLKYLDEHMNAYWLYLLRSASNGLHVFRMEYIRHRTLLLPTQSTFCAVAFLVLHAACGKTNLTIEKHYGLIPHYNKHSGISRHRRLVTYVDFPPLTTPSCSSCDRKDVFSNGIHTHGYAAFRYPILKR